MESIRIYDKGQDTNPRFIVFFMDRAHVENKTLFQCLIGINETQDANPLVAYVTPGLHLGERVTFAALNETLQNAVLRHVGVKRSVLSCLDYKSSAEDFAKFYSGATEHRNYTRNHWRKEVNNGNVVMGYWDWAYSEIDRERNEFGKFVDAGLADPNQADAPDFVMVRRSDLHSLQVNMNVLVKTSVRRQDKALVDLSDLLENQIQLNCISIGMYGNARRWAYRVHENPRESGGNRREAQRG